MEFIKLFLKVFYLLEIEFMFKPDSLLKKGKPNFYNFEKCHFYFALFWEIIDIQR